LAANLSLAVVSFHLFEQPILRLKRRFEYREEETIPTSVSCTGPLENGSSGMEFIGVFRCRHGVVPK
jgi:hypothetical protein